MVKKYVCTASVRRNKRKHGEFFVSFTSNGRQFSCLSPCRTIQTKNRHKTLVLVIIFFFLSSVTYKFSFLVLQENCVQMRASGQNESTFLPCKFFIIKFFRIHDIEFCCFFFFCLCYLKCPSTLEFGESLEFLSELRQ